MVQKQYVSVFANCVINITFLIYASSGNRGLSGNRGICVWTTYPDLLGDSEMVMTCWSQVWHSTTTSSPITQTMSSMPSVYKTQLPGSLKSIISIEIYFLLVKLSNCTMCIMSFTWHASDAENTRRTDVESIEHIARTVSINHVHFAAVVTSDGNPHQRWRLLTLNLFHIFLMFLQITQLCTFHNNKTLILYQFNIGVIYSGNINTIGLILQNVQNSAAW